MVTLKQAWNLIETRVESLPPADLSLAEAWGCLLSGEIIAPWDIPKYSVASAGGVAVRTGDLGGAGSWTLPMVQPTQGGIHPSGLLPPRSAVWVKAGGLMPGGADAVVPDGEFEVKGDCLIIREKPPEGNACRAKGSRIKTGDILFHTGSLLNPTGIGALALFGRKSAAVIPRPKIAILPIHLQAAVPFPHRHSSRPEAGAVALQSLLRKDHFTKVHLHSETITFTDELQAAFMETIGDYSVIVTIGDLITSEYLVEKLSKIFEVEEIFDEVSFQPAGNISLKRICAKPNLPAVQAATVWLISLPDDAVGVTVGFHLLIRRILARMMGMNHRSTRSIAYIARDLEFNGEMTKVMGVRLSEAGNGPLVEPAMEFLDTQALMTRDIDGYIFIEEGNRMLRKGSEVMVEWI